MSVLLLAQNDLSILATIAELIPSVKTMGTFSEGDRCSCGASCAGSCAYSCAGTTSGTNNGK